MKYVRIEMEDGGVMRGELYPEIAPETVANFEKLVNDGFYDGLTFHRIVMIHEVYFYNFILIVSILSEAT